MLRCRREIEAREARVCAMHHVILHINPISVQANENDRTTHSEAKCRPNIRREIDIAIVAAAPSI